ncbi:gamma-glutamyltransferase 5a isoform X2 [Pimephales promelas]|uniref:gamma-glutamyltransferase 5a isoform X2 n=1 Tax=Pimephales promelas TaxID=90988 RepID=UPI001955EA2D|nr:gamma-glutamyltransferase 5a isoform X2 [Pimephales promelas]KAG1926056.1 glutathione hydrolase 1 proenzyme [Pimephales promelas]
MARRKEKVCLIMSIPLICIIVIIIICVAHFNEKCAEGLYKKAAVAADSETCSKIGRDILQSGGSAVDGAIATLLCTSIINPQSMGIGGGSIFTIWEQSGKVKIINARETVPKAFKADLLAMCPTTIQPMEGAHWIGVPGDIRGYERAHKLYGRLPWASLFQPTIKMAREGVRIPTVLSRFLPILLKEKPDSPLRQLFQNEQGEQLKEGDIVKFEKLADTLEIIAEHGADALYTGDIAKHLVSDLQAAGATITLEDLSLFKASESDAWEVNLGEYDMYFPPPPAGGATLSFILNTMLGFNPNSSSLEGNEKVLTFQRYVETCKFANGLKKFMKDPNFASQTEAVEIIQKHFADKVRAKIGPDLTHDASYYNVTPYLDSHGTTHVSVLAEDGMAVSVTSTINHIFGSRIFSSKTGILLNNELADFCGKTEQIHAGEQPPSSMSPVILHSRSRKHMVVIGASGGSMITTGVALTLMNFLWFGKTLKDSIDAPVVFVDSKNILNFERVFDKIVLESLNKIGHTVKIPQMFYNVVNAVSKENNCIEAVSDSRKNGKAAGY